MGAGVGHTVFRVVMGKIIAGAAGIPGIKGKFQYLHARESAVLYKLSDGVCHVSQILGNDFLFSQGAAHGVEEADSRSLLPMASDGSVGAGRNGIVLVKSAEMVNPYHIIQFIAVGQPGQPPFIACAAVVFPAVQGISPELSCGGKAVRRAACNCGRYIVPVQLKEFRMGPCVGAVHGHIDGNVPYDADSVGIGIGF